jgi:hypothetical protein
MTASTGPKISSCAMRMSLRTPAKMVGSTNHPVPHSGRVARAPPRTAVAPSPCAMSRYCRIFSSCGRFVTGPICVSGSIGFAHPRGPREGDQPLEKRVVDAALHEQPRAGDAGLAGRGEDARDHDPFTALSISASSKTMFGDLPPSSRLTRLRPRAAAS